MNPQEKPLNHLHAVRNELTTLTLHDDPEVVAAAWRIEGLLRDVDPASLQTDYLLSEIARKVRAGHVSGAALAMESLAREVRQPGLRALLVDVAAAMAPTAKAMRDGEV